MSRLIAIPDRGRFVFLATISLVGLAIVTFMWPTESRQIQQRLAALAELASCPGQPPEAARERVISKAVVANFAESSAINIQGVVNASFDRERLIGQLTDACGWLTQLQIHLNQVSIDVARDRRTAQAHADVVIQYSLDGRQNSEHRQVEFALQRKERIYQITSVFMSANIVTQPEPRP